MMMMMMMMMMMKERYFSNSKFEIELPSISADFSSEYDVDWIIPAISTTT